MPYFLRWLARVYAINTRMLGEQGDYSIKWQNCNADIDLSTAEVWTLGNYSIYSFPAHKLFDIKDWIMCFVVMSYCHTQNSNSVSLMIVWNKESN